MSQRFEASAELLKKYGLRIVRIPVSLYAVGGSRHHHVPNGELPHLSQAGDVLAAAEEDAGFPGAHPNAGHHFQP